jgi:hypothetical protein
MKRLIPLLFLLSSCAVVPVKRNFPEAPDELKQRCGNLQTIDKEQVLFSEFLKVVTKNYTQYYNCSKIVDGWNDWYVTQKENFDKVGNK